MRRRLVGPAFRAALKSACMRPMQSGGVPSLENTKFSLNGDQTSFNNSSLISTSGCHVQDTGSYRKNPVHADGLSPLRSIDESKFTFFNIPALHSAIKQVDIVSYKAAFSVFSCAHVFELYTHCYFR